MTEFDVNGLRSLLELSEIEAVFDEHGSATEGTFTAVTRACYWQIGKQHLQLRVLAPVADPQARLVSEREAWAEGDEVELVDVDAVGDDAYAVRWDGTTQLVFVTAGQVFYLYSFPPAMDELTTLAGHVIGRV